jgi:hypothetical protein
MEQPRSLVAAPPPRTSRLGEPLLSSVAANQLIWALVGLGAALRVARYAVDRSLWLDEATLALNIADRPFRHLFGTLDFATGAPPGFLAVQKLAVTALGRSEYAFRLFPLVCGLASLPLFALLARRLLVPGAAILAMALFALSEPLVDWAAQNKPYSGDVTAALLITTAALALRATPTRGRGALFVAAAVVGMSLSYPAVFVLGGAVVYLALDRRARPVRTVLAISLVLLAGAAGIAASHTASLSRIAVNGDYKMPLGADTPHWLAGALSQFVRDPVELPRWVAIVAALLVLAGAVAFWRTNRHVLALLVLPGAAALVLAVRLYPFGPRFLLYLTPAVIVLLAAGVPKRLMAPAAVLLLAFPVGTAIAKALDPPRIEDVRPLLGQLRASWQPGDRLYVDSTAQYAFRFYEEGARSPWPILVTAGTRGGSPALLSAPPKLVIAFQWTKRGKQLEPDLSELPLAASRRTWILVTHQSPRQEQLLARELDRRGRRLAAYSRSGAWLWLYDLVDGPARVSGGAR